MALSPKQEAVVERGVILFKDKGVEKRQAITNKVAATFSIDLVEFDDEAIFELLNDTVYDASESNLYSRFIMPPFSTLDSRGGEWQARRRNWDEFLGNSLVGRKEGLAYGITGWSKAAGNPVGAVRKDDNGTSKFDSVLCELCLKWFGFKGCKVLDPFAGGHVRGAMAALCGYNYLGLDLSSEQIAANYAQVKILGLDGAISWVTDDALNLAKYALPNSQDLLFTCPPYGDLEQYSQDPRDLSNMDYADFSRNYGFILHKGVTALKDDRFAVIVVGDFRDKQGFYRGFVSDTIKTMEIAGAKLYNEAILLNSIGTASMRASGMFANRKLAKVHQNVLVFYKGNPSHIKLNYGLVDNFVPFKKTSQTALF